MNKTLLIIVILLAVVLIGLIGFAVKLNMGAEGDLEETFGGSQSHGNVTDTSETDAASGTETDPQTQQTDSVPTEELIIIIPGDTQESSAESQSTTPKETTPKETTPKETTPKETTPKETTPKETTPEETTPNDATQQETLGENETPIFPV